MKTQEVDYTTQSQGTCSRPVSEATQCFQAASKVQGGGVQANQTVSSSVLPADCFLIKYENGSTIAYFNQGESKAVCGGGEVRRPYQS